MGSLPSGGSTLSPQAGKDDMPPQKNAVDSTTVCLHRSPRCEIPNSKNWRGVTATSRSFPAQKSPCNEEIHFRSPACTAQVSVSSVRNSKHGNLISHWYSGNTP